MRHKTYIIEARREGQLVFDCPQPESFFGLRAIQGLSENEMAEAIFRKIPDATLDGASIPRWPALINENWIARQKTW